MINKKLWSEALVTNECYLFKGNRHSSFSEQLAKNYPAYLFLGKSNIVYIRNYGKFKLKNDPSDPVDDPRLWFVCVPCKWVHADNNLEVDSFDEDFYYGIIHRKQQKYISNRYGIVMVDCLEV